MPSLYPPPELSYHSRLYAISIALLAALGIWLFPIVGDDLGSVHCVRDAFLSTNSTLFLPADFSLVSPEWLGIYLKYVFTCDHFRLPNLVMPLIMLLPRWFPAAISGGCLYYIISRGARMTGASAHFATVVWMSAVMVVAYPWNDQLYLTCFQAPYLWDAALALWLLRRLTLFRRPAPAAAMLVMGFLTAFAQEAFGASLAGACCLCMLLDSRMRTRANAFALAGLVTGMLAVLLPTLLFDHWLRWSFFAGRGLAWMPYAAFCLAYPAALIIRRRRCTTTELFLAVSATIAAALTAYFNTGARVACFGVITSGIGLGMLLHGVEANKAVRAAAFTVALLLPLHLVAVDAVCLRSGRETHRAVAQYRTNPDSLIFTDLPLRQDTPWWLLQKPYYDWLHHDKPAAIFARIYGEPHHKLLRVLPAALRSYRPEKAAPIEGDAGLRSYRGLLVGLAGGTINLLADYGRGPVATRMHFMDFVADGDSTVYRWYYPDHTSPTQLLNPVPRRADVYFHYVP